MLNDHDPILNTKPCSNAGLLFKSYQWAYSSQNLYCVFIPAVSSTGSIYLQVVSPGILAKLFFYIIPLQMKQLTFSGLAVCFIAIIAYSCSGTGSLNSTGSFAVYAEFARDSNIHMKNGINRRMYNDTEIQRGDDIALLKDGSIHLKAGTYRFSGFSLVTMQVNTAPPVSKYNMNYPGYALLYYKGFEADSTLLQHQFC